MSRPPRKRLDIDATHEKMQQLRADAKAHNDRLNTLFATLPPPSAEAVAFANAIQQRELDAAHAADDAAREAARKARENPTEAIVLRAVVRALEARGWRVVRRGVSLERRGDRFIRHGTPGEADLEVIPRDPRGRALPSVFIEIKRPKGGVVSPQQERWLAARRAEGHIAGVARSPEEAIALVEQALS